MQNPKGSNNRLNEKSANRNNGNRLFDSQNNNRGGYNVPETGSAGNAFANNNANFGEGTFAQMYDVTDGSMTGANNQDTRGNSVQYDMAYQEESILRWTWTSQHGCGNAMNNCNMVLQFGCDRMPKGTNAFTGSSTGGVPDGALLGVGTRMQLHNGDNTNTPGAQQNLDGNAVRNQYNANNNAENGRHESEEFYAMCQNREREKRYFTADQKLKGHTQKYTRQNPNGQRRGLECPEERDYYPWDFPSPWIDVAWLGNDVEFCKEHIAPFSQNVSPKGTCAGPNGADDLPNNDQAAAKDADACGDASGTWIETSWGQTNNAAWADQLCQEANWSQVNHLGNVEGTALGGQMDNHEWTLPSAASLRSMGCYEYSEENGNSEQNYFRLVARQRYNISTMDYDPYETSADQNNDPKNGVISPVTQNPTVDVGAYMQGLRLALNTAQTGRTFQDRSHVFNVMVKPATDDGDAAQVQRSTAMLNVNVRGKRGNIVQTFPAVEYDFTPNDFVMSRDQCIHLQWGGSNTHNNGNPAGDGQAGDAGEGAGGTDRSNLMEMKSLKSSYPIAYDTAGDVIEEGSFFDNVQCKYPFQRKAFETGNTKEDDWLPADAVKAIFATAGYYYFDEGENELGSYDDNEEVNVLLNNVGAAFKQGLICCTKADTPAKDYYFLSTRNNNFTNRSQKMKIRVVAGTSQTFQYYKA